MNQKSSAEVASPAKPSPPLWTTQPRSGPITHHVSSLALVQFRAPESIELLHRRRELADLRKHLVAREQLLGELRAQLISFEGRYLRQVGLLYRRLDEWEEKIAELHTPAPAQVHDAAELETEHTASPANPIAFKAIFRDLVKLIHPDFAEDSLDEARRTRLMALANEAYARRDAGAIKRMLSGYDPVIALTSAEGVRNEVTRVLAMIFQVTQDVEAVNLQIRDLQRSDSAKLQEQTLEAARAGRDLLAEMAARVNGRIGLAMRRYELDLSRLRRPARGPSAQSLVTAETTRS